MLHSDHLLPSLSKVALADSEVVGILCEVSSSGVSDTKKSNSKGKDKKSSHDNTSNGNSGSERKILFQSISNNTSDYQMISSQITPLYATTTNTNNATDPKKKSRAAPSASSAEAEYKAVRGLDRLEVARLYKIALSPALGYSQAAVAAGLSPTKLGTCCMC